MGRTEYILIVINDDSNRTPDKLNILKQKITESITSTEIWNDKVLQKPKTVNVNYEQDSYCSGGSFHNDHVVEISYYNYWPIPSKLKDRIIDEAKNIFTDFVKVRCYTIGH